MKIKRIQILNHKCFVDSGLLEFTQGTNIVVGKNNSGKSTLLEALSLNFESKPHRSSIAQARTTSPVNSTTTIDISYEISGQVLKDWILSQDNTVGIPIPKEMHLDTSTPEDYRKFVDTLFDSKAITVKSTVQINSKSTHRAPPTSPSIEYETWTVVGTKNYSQVLARPSPNNSNVELIRIDELGEASRDIGFQMGADLSKFIYRFAAERLNIGRCRVGTNRKLASNAANLPEVLNNFSLEYPELYRTFNKYVSQIFTDIKYVGVKNIANNEIEIFVRTDDVERSDLTFSLNECGTGLSQVLAILYVVFSETEPMTIIIDEPNSFLHPGATKMLLGILSTFKHHQYIVSSHSPETLKTNGVSTVKLVKKEGAHSTVKSLSKEQINLTSECLIELGIEISDILASDRAVWVEGPTEQQCFPLILKTMNDWKEFTTSFLAVKNTGDFEGKHARSTIQIHNKMTQGNLLVPPSTSFIFDREDRSEKEIRTLTDLGAHLIPRKMYENYILVPEAIAQILNEEGVTTANSQNVENWINSNFGKYQKDKSSLDLQEIHGAKLLHDLFDSLSNTTLEYKKVLHGKKITERILLTSPMHLEELNTFLLEKLAT